MTRFRSAALPLVGLVVAIHAVAIWGIVTARDDARRAASAELRRETEADARSVEAALATLRGDFLFLSQSPPMARALAALSHADPMTARWGRLDVEAALFLFFDAHPSVDRVVVRGRDGAGLSALGRRHGIPTLLPVARLDSPLPEGVLVGRWPIGDGTGGATIEALVAPQRLLDGAVPRPPGRLLLRRGGDAGEPSAAVDPNDSAWSPRDGWRLVRRGELASRTDPAGPLARRVRNVLLANGAVMTLALLAGALALRQVRRAARLEEEARSRDRLRELEARLAGNERLATVGRLAANLAHEINNPLEGVENYLALLDEDLAAGRTDEAVSSAARVREGVDRIGGVVRGALGLARPPSAERERVDLAELARETAAFVSERPPFRSVAIAVDAPSPLFVSGDRSALSQLLLNLLLNGCEAQPDGGRIDLSLRAAGGRATLVVEDGGPGLPPGILPRLFEPFTSTRGGTGLGLATSRAIARDHGGDLTGRNGPRGAVFELALPLAPPAEAAA